MNMRYSTSGPALLISEPASGASVLRQSNGRPLSLYYTGVAKPSVVNYENYEDLAISNTRGVQMGTAVRYQHQQQPCQNAPSFQSKQSQQQQQQQQQPQQQQQQQHHNDYEHINNMNRSKSSGAVVSNGPIFKTVTLRRLSMDNLVPPSACFGLAFRA